MLCTINNKYSIIEKIGEGTFGKVFKAKNIHSNQEVAIKIQHKNIENVLKHEAKIYKYLNDISGVPNIRNYGCESGFNYLVLDLLGPSLSEKKLSGVNTISFILDAINIIEFIHDKGIIHRDIKPDNFLVNANTLYLIDFGLAKYYLHNNKHMEERKDKKLIGTAKFSSLNVHNGIEPSRRDDIESLCYSFILIFGKELPWGNLQDVSNIKNSDNLSLQEIYLNIKKIKEGSLEWLHDIPGEFITMLLYCRKLNFYQKPNYNYIKCLFYNLLNVL
tara:strand:- start:1303 stop:2127 length:825 start_codon:yes stop_codon:yes gene_type:complete